MILAYIDPGSGSILIQVIFASCVGGILVFWNKIKSLFAGKKPEETTEDTPEEAKAVDESQKPE